MAKKKTGKKAVTPKALRAFNWLSLQVARFCDKDDSRYQLGSVCFNGRKTVATDGRQLVVIDAPEVQTIEKVKKALLKTRPEAHEVAADATRHNLKPDTGDGKSFMLSATTVKRLGKDLEKRKKGLDHYCIVDSHEVKADKHPRVTFMTGQADGADITELRPVEGKYPAYENVIPNGEPVVVIELNPSYLEGICKLMRDVCNYGSGYQAASMKLSLYGPDKPIKVEAENEETKQKALAVLMPLNPQTE